MTMTKLRATRVSVRHIQPPCLRIPPRTPKKKPVQNKGVGSTYVIYLYHETEWEWGERTSIHTLSALYRRESA